MSWHKAVWWLFGMRGLLACWKAPSVSCQSHYIIMLDHAGHNPSESDWMAWRFCADQTMGVLSSCRMGPLNLMLEAWMHHFVAAKVSPAYEGQLMF